MNTAAATAFPLAGIVLAPLVPGVVQSAKALLQGRRGTSPLQPYRTLIRLWGKSAVDPAGAGSVYRLAPALVAACMLVALAIVPVAGTPAAGPFGHDAIVLIGMLALARATIAAAAWDTGNGFALLGAARDMFVAVFAEALLVLVILTVVLPAGSTDLRQIAAATAGGHVWSTVTHWLGLAAFCLAALVETGREPIDNPDTHLELTMIHEGPLLEYAGRDLACLQWATSARQWLVLVLGAALFLPHPHSVAACAALLVPMLLVQCLALAVCESFQAKLRLFQVPALLMLGSAVALAAVATGLAGLRL